MWLIWGCSVRCENDKNTNRKILRGLAGFLIAALILPAQAADISVRVSLKNQGDRLEGAAVCLGTSANPSQFGAFRTDAKGEVAFENLPLNTHLLTVSKQGFRGVSRLLDVMAVERVILVDLPRGGGGPVCAAPQDLRSTAQPAADGPRVVSFRLNGGVARTRESSVVLNYSVDGDINQYRVSESPKFVGASWQDVVPSLRFEMSEGVGYKRVYFQVRRYLESGGASLETVSPVVHDRIWRE